MTCEQVLDIVDGHGLVDILPRRVDAARAHALTCANCRAAFETMSRIRTQLSAREQPELLRDLHGDVMNRIASIAPRPSVASEARKSVQPREAGAQWVSAGGLAAALALAVYAGLATGWPMDRLRIGVRLHAGLGLPGFPSNLVVVLLSLILAARSLVPASRRHLDRQ